MPPSEPLRVFISYARKDGAALAQRLQIDLREKGFDVWLDTREIAAGRVWSVEIEQAIDSCHVVIAILTDGSYKSGMCRGEQIRSMRKGKRLIPVLGTKGVDIPVYIEALHYRDFTEDANYATSFAELLADIRGDAAATLPDTFRETSYVTVPPLPVNFVERPEALAALRDALITDDGGRHIALTALQGMGGVGKTVLAQALCHNEVVQQAFPDGIVWITIGKESAFDAITRMREVGKALGDDLSRYENELAAKNQYRSTIRKKAALIVVDDVWRSSDLEPLRAEDSPRSRLLFTTRDARIAAAMGAREHIADLLTDEQSREVLARWSRTEITHLPPIAAQLIHECGRLPLALSMVGAMLRGTPARYWKTVLEHLRNADLDRIKAQFPDYPYTDVLRAIQVSVDSLDPTSRARYLALAVLLEEMAAAPPVQQCLWGVDENQAAETAEQFVSLSLAQRAQPEGSIRPHDLQLDYMRAQYPDKEALGLIRAAMRLASHVIGIDPHQFASQMVGRLLPLKNQKGVKQFLDDISRFETCAWLRPLWPALLPPGDALIRTFAGHSDFIKSVALLNDGRRAISASWDNTLKIWDLENGSAHQTIHGHSRPIWAVAVLPHNDRAVSASGDGTVRVWDLESGRELNRLEGDTEGIWTIAVCPDGRHAVSGSTNGSVRLWDLETGHELHTLGSHSGAVWSVAVSGDGRRAISGGDDKKLMIWDLEHGQQPQTLEGHSSGLMAVAVCPDRKRAVSSSGTRPIVIWDLDTGHPLLSMEFRLFTVLALAVCPDGKQVVSGHDDGTLALWDLDSGRHLRTFRKHSHSVWSVAITSDGRQALSGSSDMTLKLWDLNAAGTSCTEESHSEPVNAVVVVAGTRQIVSASDDRTLRIWDLESGIEVRRLVGHTHRVMAAAVSPDGRLAVSGSYDDTLRVWDLASGQQIRTLAGHTGPVESVAMLPDGRTVVSASWDKTLRIWDLESGREIGTLRGHSDEVLAVATCLQGRRAISASRDGTLRLWDLNNHCELRTLRAHGGSIHALSVSPDGSRAISASADSGLSVWSLDSGEELRTLDGQLGLVLGVAWSPQGDLAISASNDHKLRVWDLEGGRIVTTFTCDGGARCCAFVNRQSIVAGDAAGRVLFLRLEEPKAKG